MFSVFKSQDYRALSRPTSTARCGICSERFTVVSNLGLELRHNRARPGRSAIGVQAPLPSLLGAKLSCPSRHAYCSECITRYIQSKFDSAKLPKPTFPISCPGCSTNTWNITDEDADRILSYSMLQEWVNMKLPRENLIALADLPLLLRNDSNIRTRTSLCAPFHLLSWAPGHLCKRHRCSVLILDVRSRS